MLGESEIVCSVCRFAYTKTASLTALRPEEGFFDVGSAGFCAGCGPSGVPTYSGSMTAALGFAGLFAVTFSLSGRGFGWLESSVRASAVAATERLAVLPAADLGFSGAGFILSEALVGESAVAALRRPAVFLETGLVAGCAGSGSGDTLADVFAVATVRRPAVFLETGLGVSCAGSGSGETLADVFAVAAARRLAIFLETGLVASCSGVGSGETLAGVTARIVVLPSADSVGTTSSTSRAGCSPWGESAGVSTMAMSEHSGKSTVSVPELLFWVVTAIAAS